MINRRFPVQFAAVVVFLSGCGFAPTGTESQSAPTRWKRHPTNEEITRCQPPVTDILGGSARLRCRVGAAGRLERCVVMSATNVRLGEWGLCMSARFVADETEVGREVELPLQFRVPD